MKLTSTDFINLKHRINSCFKHSQLKNHFELLLKVQGNVSKEEGLALEEIYEEKEAELKETQTQLFIYESYGKHF